MTNIVPMRASAACVTTDEYFGGCPHCGKTDGYITLNDDEHWFVCERHSARWYVGSGLFSVSDEPMTQAELAKQYRAISFRIFEPIFAQPERGIS